MIRRCTSRKRDKIICCIMSEFDSRPSAREIRELIFKVKWFALEFKPCVLNSTAQAGHLSTKFFSDGVTEVRLFRPDEAPKPTLCENAAG